MEISLLQNMNPNTINPKAEFIYQHEKEAERHMEIVSNPAFRRACEVALLEYCIRLNCEDARAAMYIRGAKAVLDILLNLGDPSRNQVETDPDDQLKPT